MDGLTSRLRASGLRDAPSLATLLETGEYQAVVEPESSLPVADLQRIFSVRAEHLAALTDAYARQLAGTAAEFVTHLGAENPNSRLRGRTFRAGSDQFEEFLVWEAEDGRIVGCMKTQPTNVAVPASEWAMYRGWS